MRATPRPDADAAERGSISTAGPLADRLRRAYVAHALTDALPRRRSWLLKRLLDLGVVIPLALVTLPIFLCMALWLWLRFHHRPTVTRVCAMRGGVAFTVRQFRAVATSDSHLESQPSAWLSDAWAMRLPALWSVVRGKMSLVGPAPWLFAAYDAVPTDALARLSVAPGMLRLRPVGRLGRLAATQADADLRYVTHGSIWMDLEQIAAAALMPGRRFPASVTPDDG
jgi:lipopolysaccharide/colanic/teichoic acid biosynthesis glycosyltransferase